MGGIPRDFTQTPSATPSQSSSPSPYHPSDSIPPSRTPSPTRTSSPSQSFSPSSSTSHSSTVSESPSPSSNPSPTVSDSVSTTPGPSLILEPFPSSPSPPLFAPSPTQSRALEPTQSQALKPTCVAQCTSGAPFESVVFSTSDSASLSASDNDGTITAQVTAPAGVVDYYSTLELSVHTINAFVTEITLVNQFGQQITELNEPIQICLAPTHNRSPDEICLGFLNEESGEWECEDCSVNHESGSDLLCGESDHLTNFALLISTEDPSDKCGSSPIQNEVIAWLSLAFLLLAILIFFAFAVATELCYRKKAANKRSFLESLQQPGSEAQSFQPHNRDSAIRIN